MDATEQMLEMLVGQYGPLLSIGDVAEILKRTPDGLRVSLARDTEIAHHLNAGRRKIGRRVYFHASAVAELIA